MPRFLFLHRINFWQCGVKKEVAFALGMKQGLDTCLLSEAAEFSVAYTGTVVAIC